MELSRVGQVALLVWVHEMFGVTREYLCLGEREGSVFEKATAVVLCEGFQAEVLRVLAEETNCYVV